MSRRLIVKRREPSGSPLASSRKGEVSQSSPRTSTATPPWNTTPRRKHSNHSIVDDPYVSTIANPPPPQSPPAASLSFLEQLNDQTPESELAPEEGALQFIPAFGASGLPPGASWSDDDQRDSQSLLQDEKKEEQRSVVSHATQNSSAFAQRARRWKKAHAARKTKSTVETPPPAANNATAGNGNNNSNNNNTRMARLASLFSSRAVVKGGGGSTQNSASTATTVTVTPPPQQPRQSHSPAPSSSSSGYVGWPGTQDKGGRTVSLPSSYDDSSAAAAGPRSSPPRQAQPEWNPVAIKHSLSAAKYEASKTQPLPPPPPATAEPEEPHFWQHFPSDAWNTADVPSSPSTFSKTSSAYFQPRELRQLAYPDLNEPKPTAETYGMAKDLTATILRSSPTTTSRTPNRRDVATPSPSPRANNYTSSAGHYTPTTSNRSAIVSPRHTPAAASPRHYTPATSPRVTPRGSPHHTPTTSPRGATTDPRVLTEERLAVRNHLTPPHRPFAAAKGYSGLIQKTQEVPSLMDDNSDTSSRATSAQTTSDVFDGLSASDVFDNLAPSPKKTPRRYPERIQEEGEEAPPPPRRYPERIDEDQEEEFKVVMLGGGLTAIQSSAFNFDNRQTASDYDENLTNSDVDPQGYTRTPDLKKMLTSGTSADWALSGIRGNFGNGPGAPPPPPQPQEEEDEEEEEVHSYDSGSSFFTDPYVNSVMDLDGELAEYYIDPHEMKKVLRRFRELADRTNVDMSLAELERAEDESKAFALFEMRSRIMEKDIERGLERRGGTVVVDDIVTTPYYRASHRIRDAVIVSKAWRDGTSPHDVLNTSVLTRRSERSYFIKRPLLQEPATSARYSRYSSPRYYWEAVRWVDDTDFAQYHCPSLGPRNLRGFEMFTVGDCQSILLKLANERCMELRDELNLATKRQIEAEELMKAEGDDGDGMMTEAEMTYLTAMEKVKTISKKLVMAEQSFALVRDRIEKLVERYQSLLLKIEHAESFTAASSVASYSSSHYTDQGSSYWDEEERREAALWARRARRAEIKAEVAARETLLARQEAQMLRDEKERELDTLRQKLTELQSEPSQAVSDRLTANRITPQPVSLPPANRESENGVSSGMTKLDGVKQRFRDRMAARKKMTEESSSAASSTHHHQPPPRHNHGHRENPQANLVRTAGEEMYQQLDFYERSLKSVNRDN